MSSPSPMTAFTDPWASGPLHPTTLKGFPAVNSHHKRPGAPLMSHSRSTSSSSSPLSVSLGPNKRRSMHASVDLTLSPKHGILPTPLVPATAMGPPLDGSSDPAWTAPESWDVDKVGPEAEDYSSDEELDGGMMNGRGGDRSQHIPSISEADSQDYIGVGPPSNAIGASGSSITGQGKRRNGTLNVLHAPTMAMITAPVGQFGMGFGIYPSRPRNKSDAYPPLPGSSHGMHVVSSFGSLRKESARESEDTVRRPSDTLSAVATSKTATASVSGLL